MLKRLYLAFLLAASLGLAAGVTGCDDNGNSDAVTEVADGQQNVDGGQDEEPDLPAADQSESVNLTGEWQRPGLGSVYALKQSGISLQGVYYEQGDPYVRGDIAGSVIGGNIEMDIVVRFTDGIRTNFVAHKTGTVISEDHIRLVVTDSPIAQGQVQNWYR